MRFNEKDKKNILISFSVAMLLFVCLFAVSEIFDDDIGDLLSSLVGRSSQATEMIFGKKNEKIIQDNTEEALYRNIDEININIDSDKLILFASDAKDFKVYTDADAQPENISITEDDETINITASSRLKTTVTVEIPKKILADNSVKIDVGETTGSVDIKAFKDCNDDILNIETYGSVGVVYSDFRSMDLDSEAAPIIVMDCTAKVISCESENNVIDIEGIYEEISLEAYSDIITNFYGDFNRLDVSSRYGAVLIGLELTDGFTARLVNCHGTFKSEAEVTLTEQSTQGSLIYRSGNGTAKINITDTKGDISLY